MHDNSALIKQIVEQETEFADDDGDNPEVETDGISLATFMRFLQVSVRPEDR